MASSQQLEVLLIAKNQTDPAFKQLAGSLKTTQAEVATTTDRMGKFAQGLGSVSTTLARSASAFGLPVQALRLLDDAADVAALGLSNLNSTTAAITTTTQLFSTATLGAVAAAGALGFGVGTLIRQAPGVAEFFDKWALGNAKMLGLLDNLPPKLTAVEQKALNAQVALEKQQQGGLSWAELYTLALEKQAAAENKRADAARKAAEKMAADAKKLAEEQKRAAQETAEFQVRIQNWWEAETKKNWDAVKEAVEKANDFIKQDTEDAYEAMQQKVKQFAEEGIRKIQEETEAANKKTEEQLELYGKMGDVLGLTSQLFGALGLEGNKALSGLLDAGNAALAVFSNLASGNIWGAIMAGISGVISLVKSLGSVLGGFFDFLDDLFGGGSPYKDPIKPFEPGQKPTNPLPDEWESGAGGGMATSWGEPWMLHGTPTSPEYVLPKEQLVGLLSDAIKAAGAASGGSYQGGATTVVPVYFDSREVTRVVSKGTRQRRGKIHPGSVKAF